MLREKSTRHGFAFVLIVLASALLYPAAGGGYTAVVWALLGMIAAANLLSLATR